MAEQTSVTILDLDAFRERTESGILVPTHEGDGLEIVDCADDRNLTDEIYQQRAEKFGHHVVSGRFFGAASGYSLTALITLASQLSEQQLDSFVANYSPEAFVDFGAKISDRAHDLWKQDIVQHSAAPNEMNRLRLTDDKDCQNPLGCAFALHCGAVLMNATGIEILDEAQRAQSEVGISKPLEDVRRGAQILSKYLPPSFGLHRGAIAHAVNKSERYTPIALVDGPHANNQDAIVDIDFANLRSDASGHNARGIARYHHTPALAAEQLPVILPEFALDPELLYASAILLAPATRRALSGDETPHALRLGVIPAEYGSLAA